MCNHPLHQRLHSPPVSLRPRRARPSHPRDHLPFLRPLFLRPLPRRLPRRPPPRHRQVLCPGLASCALPHSPRERGAPSSSSGPISCGTRTRCTRWSSSRAPSLSWSNECRRRCQMSSPGVQRTIGPRRPPRRRRCGESRTPPWWPRTPPRVPRCPLGPPRPQCGSEWHWTACWRAFSPCSPSRPPRCSRHSQTTGRSSRTRHP